jgi:hypothetical protein
MRACLLFVLAIGLSAAISLNPNPLYDFANGCPGLIPLGLPPFVCKQESYNGDIFVISALTHQVLKLSADVDNYQCSVYGYLPGSPGGSVSGTVNIGGSFSLGLTIDPDGNIYVSNTGAGPASGDYGSLWKIPVDGGALPIQGQRIWTSTSIFGLPSGLSTDWRNNRVLLSSETDGTIYYVALDGSSSGVWASGQNPTYALLSGTSGIPGFGGTITNTNLFGAPFGPVASSISTNGKILYVGSAERGLMLAIEIKDDGTAGALSIVGSSPEHTIEGAWHDNSKKKLYFGTVFRNGTNLSPDGPNGEYNGGVRSGNSVWVTDLLSGVSERFYDARLGAVCSVGTAKGVLNQGQNKILVISSGFDFLPAWPLGQVRLGTQPYPVNGVDGSTTGPALTVPYNGKLWVLNV